MIVTVLFRRGTASQWTTKNPILKSGEPGFETDTGKVKIGNGTLAWNALSYLSGVGGGTPGADGLSAYQLAVNAGYVGDLSSWLLSLKGAKGDKGDPGNPGTPGTPGTPGAPGAPGDASTLNSFVTVSTGSEPRPDAPLVVWVGGFDFPEHMGPNDIWFSEGDPPDTTAPSVPSGLFATLIGTDRFTLSWTSSTDNVAVDHYEYRLNGGAPVTATSPRLITGLNPETLYTVEVRAFDAAGNPSAWSTSIPVTTEAESAFLSIFGPDSPGATTIFEDGGGSLRVTNRFYATRALVVRGVRFWNPVGADSTFLNRDITFYVYTGDYAGGTVPEPVWASPLQTKTHTALRVAGEWTEILFDVPINLLPINPGTLGADFVSVGYQMAGGQTYVHRVLSAPDTIPSIYDASVHFAEGAFPRAANTLGGGGSSAHYGLDILFEEA